MNLNANRQSVASFDLSGDIESCCPLCDAVLTARRGELLIWHWAHRAGERSPDCEGWTESEWHLRWKNAAALLGATQEVVVEREGRRFVIDAVGTKGSYLEFVHSLSPCYVAKHEWLTRCGETVKWFIDGNALGSAHAKPTKDGRGMRKLLKPAAYSLARKLVSMQAEVYADHGGTFWTLWKDNVWYKTGHLNVLHRAWSRTFEGSLGV